MSHNMIHLYQCPMADFKFEINIFSGNADTFDSQVSRGNGKTQ